jgi:hypothetical protein
VPDAPVDWPEGLRVSIQPCDPTENSLGMTDEEQSDDPQQIADWLARFDALEPLETTAEEEAELMAFRAQVKRVTFEAVRRRMEEIE